MRTARAASALLGVAIVIAIWAILSTTVLKVNSGVPTPWAVVDQWGKDGWSFYGPNVRQTFVEAAKGYLIGNAAAIALAMLVLVLPMLERTITQIAVASYCLPVVAIGPILTLLTSGDKPMVGLAILQVFFVTVVGSLLGLRSADKTSLDMVRAYGGGRWTAVYKVRLIAALPSVFTALKIAAPAAVLGAIIGEYLGGVDHGLGVAMVVSETQLDIARTWGIALVAGAMAGVGYGALGLLSRLVLPWNSAITVGSAT